ncbi:MAG: GIY-YIG nuclease family protein [Elusimicrobia bacterium]|nr:GIY-YIG nuclease family protein [Elusimicrobiota bacterium]
MRSLKMCFVYILQSEKDNGYYIGSTHHLTRRIERHSQGRVNATKSRRPLKLVYFEKCPSYSVAMKKEKFVKKQKSRKYIENLIKNFKLSP